MKIQIICQDKHEAAKLASLIFIKDGKETFISSIINTYDNEVVISLKDKSAHSIVLKNSYEVERFADFIQSVLDDDSQIIYTKTIGELVEIEKS
ncbi:MAG: hypothetical protein ABI337_01805 [Nitrososphaera sp.]|jgi:Mg2+/Co2+ transporter CorC